MSAVMFTAEPKLMVRVGGPEQDARRGDTSKAYWRNWLLVDARCCEQREMEVKVSSPLKRRYVERLFDASLDFVSVLNIQF